VVAQSRRLACKRACRAKRGTGGSSVPKNVALARLVDGRSQAPMPFRYEPKLAPLIRVRRVRFRARWRRSDSSQASLQARILEKGSGA
jgi:hypothetical protein